MAAQSRPQSRQLGDVNNDGVLSVVDLTLVRLHVRNVKQLDDASLAYADVNADGVVNEDDAVALIRLITGQDTPRSLPITGIRETNPQNGEEGVSSNRKTGIVIRFSMPLADTSLDQQNFYASVNGRKLNSRAELSSDGRKAALFITDKVPGDTRVDVSLVTDNVKDLLGRVIDGDGDGISGGTFTLFYKTEPLVVVPNTVICGTVYASEKVGDANVPLAGVKVRVAGSENAQVLTDSNGAFRLECPAGRFFAEVDGREAAGSQFPDGNYYPYVVKAWEAVAGSDQNLAAGTGKIYLPLVPAGALKEVSPTETTKVEMTAAQKQAQPELAEVSLTVPAGALRDSSGNAVGGKVGMAAVDPDRTPEPLAPDLKFPLVITIQTDGSPNFDQPVAVKFPNLPDPVTGEKLKPGEKSALWSFNHDTGTWEMQGPMTVTDDGKYVVSDPGVGVRQAGWHGVLPGSQGVGPRRPIQAPASEEEVKKDVKEALTTVAQSSLFVRDAFLRMGAMRGLSEDMQQIRSLLDEVRSVVDDYNRSGSLPYWWTTQWMKLRIGKLGASYATLLGSGEGSLSKDLALLQPNLASLKSALQSLQPFNQRVFVKNEQYHYLANDFAISNANLLDSLTTLQAYVETLRAGVPTLDRTAFETVVKVLFPPIGTADPTQRQEMDALARFVAELEPIAAVVAYDHASRFLNLELQMSDYLARAGVFSTAENPTPKNGYLVVDAIGEPQRIRSNGSGDYRVVLPPNKEFAVTYVDPKTLRIGCYVGISNWNGVITDLYGPVLAPLPSTYVDTDGDKLADAVEYVIGTDPKLKDTDKDGISDGAEVTKGKNPLSGIAVGTGVVYSMTTSQQGNEAVDLDTGNDLLLVAESSNDSRSGALVVYGIDNKLEPARQSILPLNYTPSRVKYGDGGYAILSLRENGVGVVDVSNPASPKFRGQYDAGEGRAVACAILVGDVLVMGVNHLSADRAAIVFKDLASGETTFEQEIGGVVSDIIANGTTVYVLNKGTKSEQYWWWYWAMTTAIYSGDVSLGSRAVFTPVTVREWEWSKSGGRLALTADRLFAVYESGLTSLKLTNPLAPILEGEVFKPESGFQRGWRQVLFDGSQDPSTNLTTFVAALGSSPVEDPVADADIAVFQFGLARNFGSSSDSWWKYWMDQTTPMARFTTRFDSRSDRFSTETLASGRIASISMAGGVVYAADRESGVKVVNYRKYDSLNVAPTIQLTSNSPSSPTMSAPRVASGSLLALRAIVRDDVAVASVDWYLNGARVASTGGFPWGYTMRAPLLSGSLSFQRFKIEARVFDTGGNQATTSEWNFDAVTDPYPPRLLSWSPGGGKPSVAQVSLAFNEPMSSASFTGALQLFSSGPDGTIGTPDDVQISGGSLVVSGSLASLTFSTNLPDGRYRAKLKGTVSDLAGNPIGEDFLWDFSVSPNNTWIGPSLGLWSDPANWSSGTVPAAGERVVFPKEGAPRVVIGGRTTFTPTDASGNQLALKAGATDFSRVLTKNMPGGWWWWGNSSTPAPLGTVRVGMRVTGQRIADGTVVNAVTVVNDVSDPTAQKQTTSIVLSAPLGEAIQGALPWVFSTNGDLSSLQVDGETTLVDMDLQVADPIVLGARLSFSGECNVSVDSVNVREPAARLAVLAGVDTGTLVGGGSATTSGVLRFVSGLRLINNLGVEAAGIGGSTKVEVVSSLNLAGKSLDFFGGYGGALKLSAGPGVKTFTLEGGGKVAFKWSEALLADGSLQANKLVTKVSVPRLTLPEGVEWGVAGLGKVQVNATEFLNSGTIRVDADGWLSATHYRLAGEIGSELVADTGTFEKAFTRVGGKEIKTASFQGRNLAIKEDGTLWAWGYNGSGELGLGSSWGVVNVPTRVGTDTDWVSIQSWGSTSFGLKADGTLWAWGDNYEGRLGVGYSGGVVNVPTQVGTDTDWVSIRSAVGLSYISFGLKADGTLWAWGYNWNGELGVGYSGGVVNVPTQVGTDTDWVYIEANGYYESFNFGLKADGTLWAWGYNGSGILGIGSSETYLTVPTRIESTVAWRLSSAKIRIETNSPSPQNLRTPRIASGTTLALSATPLGRVNIGSIEWYVNGKRTGTANASPWSLSTTAPTLSEGETSRRLNVQAYVYDSTGVLVDVTKRDIDVVRDATPPVVVGQPSIVSSDSGTVLQVGFSKPLEGSPTAGVFKLISAGGDGLFGNGDDFEVGGGTFSVADTAVTVSFEGGLAGGRYRLVLDRGLLDAAGNPLGTDYKWDFVTTSTWIGPAFGTWWDSANWSNNSVPRAGGRVLFPATSGPRVVLGDRNAPVNLESLQVSGETTLINVVMNVANEVSLNADLVFSGENDLKAGRISAASTGRISSGAAADPQTLSSNAEIYRMKVVARVDASYGDLSVSTGMGVLRIGDGLTLATDLEVESTGVGGATRFELGTRLALGGKTLRLIGGYGGAFKLTSASNSTPFVVDGPGSIQLGWQEALLMGDINSLSLKLEAPGVTVPAGVRLEVAGLGMVEVISPRFTNAGTVSVGEWGWLRIGNYGTEGSAVEDVAENAVFEKPTLNFGFRNAKKVAAAVNQTYAIKEDGTLWAWGDNRDPNDWRTLGLGFSNDQGLPVRIPTQLGSDNRWVSIASEWYRTLGLKSDGTLWEWGRPKSLADGGSSVPMLVGSDSDWVGICVGFGNACAIKKDGTLWSLWSDYGLIEPARMSLDSDWSEIASNYDQTYGLKTDGSLWFWGYDFRDGIFLAPNSPRRVEGSGWEKIATASSGVFGGPPSSFGLKADGTLWAWGYNEDGRLGLGFVGGSVLTPTQIGEAGEWLDVATYAGLTYAIKKDGSLWTWGSANGTRAVFGDGFSSPAPVGIDKDWSHIVEAMAGFGVKQDGSLWAWGGNSMAVSGTGLSDDPLSTPTRVGLNVNWPQRTEFARITSSALTSPYLTAPRISIGGTVSLSAGFNGGTPVGTVEWYVNGMRVGQTSGGAFSWTPPQGMLRPHESTRRIQIAAKILDAEGNYITSSSSQFEVVRDAVAPEVVGHPSVSTGEFGLRIGLTFSKAMDAYMMENKLKVFSAGEDGVLGTADDIQVQGASFAYSEQTATLTFANGLGEGTYRVAVEGALLDTAGNPLVSGYSANITIAAPLTVVSATPANFAPVPVGLDLTTGLVVYYPFDGDANDHSGNGKHALVDGASISRDRHGNVGGYRLSDANKIKLPIERQFYDGAADFTISLWLILDGSPKPHSYILAGWRTSMLLDLEDGEGLVFYQQTDDGPSEARRGYIRADRPFQAGQWNQLILSKSGSKYTLFLNGSKVGESTGNTPIETKGGEFLSLGNVADLTLSEFTFNGSVDDFRFYARGLNDLEAKGLYASENALFEADSNGHTVEAVPGANALFSRHETTVGQWRAFVSGTGWHQSEDWRTPGFNQADDHPVVNVARSDAREYCAWLTARTGRHWRLPFSAEWSAAAGTRLYPWGDHYPPLTTDGNYDGDSDGYLQTAPVGRFYPNLLGLYDMGGNVQEWMDDDVLTIRGGCWGPQTQEDLKTEHVYLPSADNRRPEGGFRVVQDFSARVVSVTFNRPVASPVSADVLKLYSAGVDGLTGTADDVLIHGGSLFVSGRSIGLSFAENLSEGLYRGIVSQAVQDTSGVSMGLAYEWTFSVGTTNRWKASGGGSWFDPSNWSCGRVPNALDVVVFPATVLQRVVEVNGPVKVRSLRVEGETTMENIELETAENLTLAANLSFSGLCSLSSAGVAAENGARICIKESAPALGGELSLGRGLALQTDLKVETAGVEGPTLLNVAGSLSLSGHSLTVLGGVDGAVNFSDGALGESFTFIGPGKVVFDWQEDVWEDPAIDVDALRLQMNANRIALPSGVEWRVEGAGGMVKVEAVDFSNSGIVRVLESGFLKIPSYRREATGQELIGFNATFEKF